MATLIELQNTDALFKLDPELGPGRQEDRYIYLLPPLRDWLRDVLPTLQSDLEVELTPLDQLYALFDIFCSGETLTFDEHFKPISHIRHGIWELRTTDLRVFGWFYRKDCFIGSAANETWRIKQSRLYGPYRDECVRRRDTLPLDDPKFIPGDNPHDVVSAFDFAG